MRVRHVEPHEAGGGRGGKGQGHVLPVPEPQQGPLHGLEEHHQDLGGGDLRRYAR